ncbi:MAG: hypothetical protein DCC64_15915 [Planctomycetota bacterium]|nr:MAG: hypothetical protein DCC64_15915 [Planctomycetota bacterium]
MRQFLYLFATGVICSASTYFITHQAAADAHSAAVVTDDVNGIVRIVIDGKEVVRVDAAGVEINGVLKPERLVHPVSVPLQPGGNE